MPKDFASYLQEKEEQWENLCIRCGGCCGAFDDPCKHLKLDAKGLYYCEIYQNRFGTRETVGKEKFDCVLVKEILDTHWPNDHLCVYKKMKKMPWIMFPGQRKECLRAK